MEEKEKENLDVPYANDTNEIARGNLKRLKTFRHISLVKDRFKGRSRSFNTENLKPYRKKVTGCYRNMVSIVPQLLR